MIDPDFPTPSDCLAAWGFLPLAGGEWRRGPLVVTLPPCAGTSRHAVIQHCVDAVIAAAIARGVDLQRDQARGALGHLVETCGFSLRDE